MSGFQERNQPASAKRLQDAKKQGMIARSNELTMALMVITSAAIIYIVADSLLHTLQNCLTLIEHAKQRNIASVMHHVCSTFIFALIPICLIYLSIIFAGSSLAGGFSWLPEQLIPKSSRLNPSNGLSRLFSINSTVQAIKTLSKFIIIGGTCAFILAHSANRLMLIEQQNLTLALHNALRLIGHIVIGLVACLVFFAALDIPYQYWMWTKGSRMTLAELQEEQKNTNTNNSHHSKGQPHG